jgi:hypothetical protein
LNERASKLRSAHIACLAAPGQQRLRHTEDGLATTAERHKFLLLVGKIYRAVVFLLERKQWSQSTDHFSRINIKVSIVTLGAVVSG